MRLWRICRQRYAAESYSGEGARLFRGRWNSCGIRMVYTSTSLALAAVETFVHIEPRLLPEDLVSTAADLPDALEVTKTDIARLPPGWTDSQGESARAVGDAWIRAGQIAALAVPSVVIAGEWNVLLNPAHPDMARISIDPPVPFRFDGRMFQMPES